MLYCSSPTAILSAILLLRDIPHPCDSSQLLLLFVNMQILLKSVPRFVGFPRNDFCSVGWGSLQLFRRASPPPPHVARQCEEGKTPSMTLLQPDCPEDPSNVRKGKTLNGGQLVHTTTLRIARVRRGLQDLKGMSRKVEERRGESPWQTDLVCFKTSALCGVRERRLAEELVAPKEGEGKAGLLHNR